MSDVETELYTIVKGLFTADSGGTGLNNSASAAYVRNFCIKDDANLDRDGTNLPEIMVGVENAHAMDAPTRGQYVVSFRMYVGVWRDANGNSAAGAFPDMGAILARVRTVYHRAVLGAGTDFTFGMCQLRNIVRLQAGPGKIQRSVDFRVLVNTASGV